ncbi:hypothetical protein HK105_207976 [Polyrhizophydium stewartii]|uniref:Mannose-P-dolichol utilization defect 1 protein homolog n=1 Tax=Polyrhizophydium stewartii TaxID=2732419 RepID=A0ABR4MZ68_9FUNG|nr:hypothetical protein HK105_000785 [Polyrhizophydium stewartii]
MTFAETLLGEQCARTLFPATAAAAAPGDMLPCAVLATSKLVGLSILVAGSLLKLPQLRPVLARFSTRGIPFAPLMVETIGLSIVVAFHSREGNPFSTWGECVSMLVCNIIMVLVHWASAGMHLRAAGFVAAMGAWLVLLLNPAGWVSPAVMTLLLALTFPMFLGSNVTLIAVNHRNKHIGHISPEMLMAGAVCGWGRAFTALVEINDSFVQFQSIVGAIAGTVLVVQVLLYRENTSRYLAAAAAAELDLKPHHHHPHHHPHHHHHTDHLDNQTQQQRKKD